GKVRLVLDGALCPFADDQVGLDVGLLQRFEQSHAENGAGRSSHADNDASHQLPRVSATWAIKPGPSTYQRRCRLPATADRVHVAAARLVLEQVAEFCNRN